MFGTVQGVEDLLQIEISTAEAVASCERAIAEASEVIRNYTHQQLSLVSDELLTLDCPGGTRIFLPELPVISVSGVLEAGVVLAAGTDYLLGQHGTLYRIGQMWPVGVQNIRITYTHGYAVAPEDIEGVCTRSAARVYQAGLRSKEQNGVMGVASVTLGDYAVSYGAEAGGGVGEGVMGVSAARVLLLSEKDILNRYRYVKY